MMDIIKVKTARTTKGSAEVTETDEYPGEKIRERKIFLQMKEREGIEETEANWKRKRNSRKRGLGDMYQV